MPDDRYLTELRQNMQRNGKYATQGDYLTKLSPAEERAFRGWVTDNKVPFNPGDAISDYDMRGFWKALQEKDPRAASAIQYPDVWKTPYHKTFSDESIYAMPNAPKAKDGPPAMEIDTRPIPAHPSGRYPTLDEIRHKLQRGNNPATPYVPISSGGFVRG